MTAFQPYAMIKSKKERDYGMENLIELFLANALLIFCAKTVVILLVTYSLTVAFKHLVRRTRLAGSLNFTFLTSVITAIIWVLGIITILSNISGMSSLANKLLAGSGIIAVVLSIGAQKSFGNIISGVILSVSRPFDIGDRIIIKNSSGDIIGFVEDITIRHVVIRTYKNTTYIIANSELDTMIIENTSRNNDKGITEFIDVSVAYESDLEKAIEILRDVVGNHELFFDTRTPEDIENGVQKVTVRVREFGGSGILLRVSVRTRNIDDSFVICSDCKIAIKKEFNQNNIEIPYSKIVVVEQ
jgi:small-conductance mechanosensitive channel